MFHHQVIGKHLDRDDAVQPWVSSAVHFAHPARAQRGQNLEVTETGSRSAMKPRDGIIDELAAG